MITVLSAVYGAYDPPVEPPKLADTRWIMVTDDPDLYAPGWEIVVEPHPHLHPRMAAKVPKCLPWRHAEPPIIWTDAAARFTGASLYGLRDVVPDGSIGMFRHPWRQDIYAETLASESMGKYAGQPMDRQVRSYRSAGLPPNHGLWAAGCIVYRRWDEPFGRAWLHEQLVWSYQDQLSLPYVLWRTGDRLTDLGPGDHMGNPWLSFHPHSEDWR